MQTFQDVTERARGYLDPKEIELVIWHGGCTDGFAAAFAAWRSLGSCCQFKGETYMMEGEDRDFDFLKDKVVLIVDFSYPRSVMVEIQKLAKKVLLLDHHKTALKNLCDLEGCFFDLTRSGAGLAWNYFFPGIDMPMFIQFIQDRDLGYRNGLKDSRAFTSVFYQLEFDFELFDKYMDLKLVQNSIDAGQLVVEMVDNSVKEEAKRSSYRRLSGYLVRVINSRNHISDLGHFLSKDPNVRFGAVFYWDLDKDCCKVSLRSDGVRKDVSEIAEEYGGGGHPAAASFFWKGHINDLFTPV